MLKNYIGTRDFLPEEWRVMKYIFSKWREVSEQYGFEEYSTPTLEQLELFTKKSGEEIKHQLFWFKDKGDRKVCLPAELTPQLARMVINYGKRLKKPLKWFSIPKCFRYERPQKGRYREFYQYNADIIGDKSVLATAEMINLSIKILKALGLEGEFKVHINSRKVLEFLARRLGANDINSFYLLLDKRYKMSNKEFFKEMKAVIKEVELLKELMNLSTNELLFELSKMGCNVDRIKELFEYVDREHTIFDISIIRGLAYYTDIVFETYDNKMKFRAICGGGEYDNLISDFGGEKTPAVGFGMGDAVLLEVLKENGKIPKFENNTIFIATVGNVAKDAFKLREKLIEDGYKVDLNITNKSLSKQLSYAAAKGIKEVIIIGKKELEKGIITKKNLETGKEEKISL